MLILKNYKVGFQGYVIADITFSCPYRQNSLREYPTKVNTSLKFSINVITFFFSIFIFLKLPILFLNIYLFISDLLWDIIIFIPLVLFIRFFNFINSIIMANLKNRKVSFGKKMTFYYINVSKKCTKCQCLIILAN